MTTLNKYRILLPLAALILILMAGTAFAYNTTTISGLTVTWGVGGDASSLENSYLANGILAQETFESGFAYGDTGDLTLSLGTLKGNGYVSNTTGVQAPETGEHNVTPGGQYYYSDGNFGTTAGVKNPFSIELFAPTDTLGFYIIDPNDIGGTFTFTVSNSVTGASATFTLSGNPGNAADLYFVLTSDWDFDTISFVTTVNTNDGIGIDDISIAKTPIPGAVWLLGTGLLGLLGLRGRFKG